MREVAKPQAADPPTLRIISAVGWLIGGPRGVCHARAITACTGAFAVGIGMLVLGVLITGVGLVGSIASAQ